MSSFNFCKTGLIALCVMSLTLGGCGWQITAPDAHDQTAPPIKREIAPDGWQQILESIKKNQVIKHYSIKAETSTRVQGLAHKSSIYGHVTMPDQIVMSQNVDGRGYYFYQGEEGTYFRDENVWQSYPHMELPDSFRTLDRLAEITPQQVYRLPDIILISFPAEVYQFEADAMAISGTSIPSGQKVPSLYTFYIDKKSRLLKAIEIATTDSLEDAGTVSSETRIDYFDLAAKESLVVMPDELKKHLKEENKKRN